MTKTTQIIVGNSLDSQNANQGKRTKTRQANCTRQTKKRQSLESSKASCDMNQVKPIAKKKSSLKTKNTQTTPSVGKPSGKTMHVTPIQTSQGSHEDTPVSKASMTTTAVNQLLEIPNKEMMSEDQLAQKYQQNSVEVNITDTESSYKEQANGLVLSSLNMQTKLPFKIADATTTMDKSQQPLQAQATLPTEMIVTSMINSKMVHQVDHEPQPSLSRNATSKPKDLSEIGEAVRETSSIRMTATSTNEKIQQHIKRLGRYIQRQQQKIQLLGGARRAALLSNSNAHADEQKDIEEVLESVTYFLSHFKNAPSEQLDEINSICSTLPSLFDMLKKPDHQRIAYLCKTIIQNIQNLPAKMTKKSSDELERLKENNMDLQCDNLHQGGQNMTTNGAAGKIESANCLQVNRAVSPQQQQDGNSRTYVDASKVKNERVVEQHQTQQQFAAPAFAMPEHLDDGNHGSKPLILETVHNHSASGNQRDMLPNNNQVADAATMVHYEVVVQAKVFVNEIQVPVKTALKSDSMPGQQPAQPQPAAITTNLCKFKVNQPLTFQSKKQALSYVLQFM